MQPWRQPRLKLPPSSGLSLSTDGARRILETPRPDRKHPGSVLDATKASRRKLANHSGTEILCEVIVAERRTRCTSSVLLVCPGATSVIKTVICVTTEH
jgi:hypothetical protein